MVLVYDCLMFGSRLVSSIRNRLVARAKLACRRDGAYQCHLMSREVIDRHMFLVIEGLLLRRGVL